MSERNETRGFFRQVAWICAFGIVAATYLAHGPRPRLGLVGASPVMQSATATPAGGEMRARGYFPIALKKAIHKSLLHWKSLPPYADCTRQMVFSPTNTFHLSDLAVDGRGTIWFATNRGALGLGEDGEWRSLDKADGLPYDRVQSIGIDAGGNPWFGTSTYERLRNGEFHVAGGLSGYNYSGLDTFRDTVDPGGHALGGVEDVAGDAQGGKWVITGMAARGNDIIDYGGVYYLSTEREWTRHTTLAGFGSEGVARVLVDAYNNVWIHTLDGLAFQPNGGDWTQDLGPGAPSARAVWTIGSTPNRDQIWLIAGGDEGSETGLSIYRRGAAAAWQRLPGPPDGTLAPQTIGADAKGNFFWASEGGAGVRWADGRWERFPETDLLGSRYISKVISDRSGLWFALWENDAAALMHMVCP